MFSRLRKAKIFFLLFTTLFILTACGSSNNNGAEGDYVVSEFQVLVLDGENDPVGDADVTLDQNTVSTNDLGVAVFEDLSSGNYTIQVEADNYENYSVNINIGKELQDYTAKLLEEPLSAMVLIEAGTTSSDNGLVTVEEDFYLGRYHVTQGEYEALMNKYYEDPYGENRSKFADEPDSHNRPIESLMWIEAAMYANALSEEEGFDKYYNIDLEEETLSRNENANGYRLPTPTEHKYAARGGKNGEATEFPGSDKVDEVAWYSGNSQVDLNHETRVVGLKAPNELGLYDMAGNVNDWLDDGRGFTDSVLYRGGSYNSTLSGVKVESNTNSIDSYNLIDQNTGFRLARTP